MSFLDSIKFQQKEERVKQYLLPQCIVLTKGKVKGAGKLLKEKDLQIDLYEPTVTILENGPKTRNKAGILLDFGFEFHGGLRLLTARIKGSKSAGATLPDAMVTLSFGESVSEALSKLGEKGACNDHSPRQFTVPVSALSDLEFGQSGYRFVYIQLESCDCLLQLKSAVGVFVYRELDYKGSFTCSDPLLNKIFDTAAYTCHLNLQNLLWDGIKRDRLVWVGDTHPEMLTIRALFGQNETLEESLRFARRHAPLPNYMNGMPSYSVWWLLILHDYIMATGDKKFLNENKKYTLALAEQIASLIPEDGTHDLPDYFLDWPTRYTPAAEAGVHGLLILCMEACAELAHWYHDTQAEERFTTCVAALKLRCPDCGSAKQAIAMQTLAGLRDRKKTAQTLTADGAKGMSTFMSYYILKAMCEGNMSAALS
ncbi:MAG: alpha-L-rhamnosidase, partial [Oscillospiraceae bacterium]|nr:alpha-L-rhamnosidase [Oscillospiraceae bacterium]